MFKAHRNYERKQRCGDRTGPLRNVGPVLGEIVSDWTHQECDLSSWKCYYFRAIPVKGCTKCAAVVTVDSIKASVPQGRFHGFAMKNKHGSNNSSAGQMGNTFIWELLTRTKRRAGTGFGLRAGGLVGPLIGVDAPHRPPLLPTCLSQSTLNYDPVTCPSWRCSGPVIQAPRLLLSHQLWGQNVH